MNLSHACTIPRASLDTKGCIWVREASSTANKTSVWVNLPITNNNPEKRPFIMAFDKFCEKAKKFKKINHCGVFKKEIIRFRIKLLLDRVLYHIISLARRSRARKPSEIEAPSFFREKVEGSNHNEPQRATSSSSFYFSFFLPSINRTCLVATSSRLD